jgi:hypothetical protein
MITTRKFSRAAIVVGLCLLTCGWPGTPARGAVLKGWYKLDEPGTAAGTYMNGVTLGEAGAPVPNGGTSARFDGTDDYVQVIQGAVTDTSLKLGSRFSVEYWIKCEVGQLYPTIVAKGDVTRRDNEVLTHHVYSDRSFCHIVSFLSNLTYQNTVPVEEWVHVAVTHHSYNAVTIYLNGSAAPLQYATRLNPAANAEDDFFIGVLGALLDEARPGVFYKGWIDEVAVFDGRLTPAEVLDHYHNGIPEPAALSLLALGGLGVMLRRKRR